MKLFLKICLLVLIVTSELESYSQSHYIVEIDRINNTKSYKVKKFDKGRPVETAISKPSLVVGDIITLRMINFNELLYGLDVQKNLQGKSESVFSTILKNSDLLLGPFGMSPAVGQLTNLLRNPPDVSVSRGDEGQYSISSMHKRTVLYLQKISEIDNEIKKGFGDEGLAKDEIENKLDDLERKFAPALLKNEYNSISNDLDKVLDTTDGGWMLIFRSLNSFNETDIDNLETSILSLKAALRNVDFISEQTFTVDNDQSSPGNITHDYEKFEIKANIYKRAVPLSNVADAKETIIPYNISNVRERGDQLHQSIVASFSIKNKYKPFFGIGINRIFVAENRYYYEIGYNAVADSMMFKSNTAGGTKTSVGLNLCFDLPFKSSSITLTGTIGYAMAFWKSYAGNQLPVTLKKGFVTTGMSAGLKKFRYVTLSGGCAWSEYDKLSSTYQADKYYLNNISDAGKNNAITKTIKPSFYLGLSINL